MKTPNDKALREHLLYLLNGDGAHSNFEGAIKNMPPALRCQKPKGSAHSPWEVLEHLRIALWDILEFVRNPKHVSPEFPAGYWPSAPTPPNDKAWDESANAFRHHSTELAGLIANESTDLFSAIPHGGEKTILREILLVADHNAYHLGELVLLRRLLGAWQ